MARHASRVGLRHGLWDGHHQGVPHNALARGTLHGRQQVLRDLAQPNANHLPPVPPAAVTSRASAPLAQGAPWQVKAPVAAGQPLDLDRLERGAAAAPRDHLWNGAVVVGEAEKLHLGQHHVARAEAQALEGGHLRREGIVGEASHHSASLL